MAGRCWGGRASSCPPHPATPDRAVFAEQPNPVPEPGPPACKEADRIQSLVSGKEDYTKQQHLAGLKQQRLKGREELGAIINQQQLDLQPKPLSAPDCTQPGRSSHPSRRSPPRSPSQADHRQSHLPLSHQGLLSREHHPCPPCSAREGLLEGLEDSRWLMQDVICLGFTPTRKPSMHKSWEQGRG